MGADVDQIVAKLTASELDLLQDTFGVNLRDSGVVHAFTALEDTRRRIRAIEERVLRKRREEAGERPHCSFCGGTPEQTGMLCQSSMVRTSACRVLERRSRRSVTRARVTPNKQWQRTVERYRGRAASASLPCARAVRDTPQRAAGEPQH